MPARSRWGRFGSVAARQFFEATNFVPVRIRKLGDAAGFVTGYYEPIVDGSRVLVVLAGYKIA